MQYCTHGCGRGVCHQGDWSGAVRVSEHGGARQTNLALLEGLAERWCPGDGLRKLGAWAGEEGV